MSSIRNAGRADLKTKVGIYLLFLAVYLTGASGHFYSTDHVAVYLTTQSIVEDGDLSIRPILNTTKGRDGASFAGYGVGQSLLAVPLYVVGRTVDNVSPPRVRTYFEGYSRDTRSLPEGGAGTVPIFFVSLFNQLVAPLICVLVFMFLLELGFSTATSFFTTLVFGFGTAVFVAAHEFFQHPLETLLLLGTIYVLFVNRANLRARHALLAGALLGFGLLTRIDLVIVAPAIGVYLVAITRNAQQAGRVGQLPRACGSSIDRLLAWSGLRPIDTRPLRNVCAFALPIALSTAIILALNYVKYENAFNFGVASSTTASGAAVPNTHFSLGQAVVGLYGYLVSPGRSVFLYSPPAILGFIGARRFYDLRRAESLLFGTIGCTYLVFYGSQDLWHGGWAWGPRYLLPTLPLIIISSAYALEHRRTVLLALALGVAGFAVQVLGTVENVGYVTSAHGVSVTRGNEPYLFVPQISPLPTHLKDLLQNRNVDLWLIYVWDQFGTGVMLLTLAVPVSLLAAAGWLLRDIARAPGWGPEPAPSDER
jgi:hypothetical protein